MIAQEDSPELFEWLLTATGGRQPFKPPAGDFLRSLAEAGLRADAFNYAILRPVLLKMKEKYPEYALPSSQRPQP